MTAPEGAVVELTDVSRAYGERVALEGLSLRLARGQTLVVFGPNGAGKSTLLRILATLLRHQHGTVRVLGKELPGEGWEVRGHVGFLGHEPLLYRELTGRENLRFHARLHGVAEARVDAVLSAVELLAPVIGRESSKTRVVVTHDVAGGLEEADVTLGLRAGAAAAVDGEAASRDLYR